MQKRMEPVLILDVRNKESDLDGLDPSQANNLDLNPSSKFKKSKKFESEYHSGFHNIPYSN